MCGIGTQYQIWILLWGRYPELPGPGCGGHSQHPKVWVPMKSPKGSAMEGSLVFKKGKKCSRAIIAMLFISKMKESSACVSLYMLLTSHIHVLSSYIMLVHAMVSFLAYINWHNVPEQVELWMFIVTVFCEFYNYVLWTVILNLVGYINILMVKLNICMTLIMSMFAPFLPSVSFMKLVTQTYVFSFPSIHFLIF